MLTIYGDPISGNCMKVRWVAELLGVPFEWRDVDVVEGEARTPAFLALNPAGKVPFVVLADGRSLSESNAIILHLADGSALVPTDAFERAVMLQWLFWEQYSHEPYVAVRRFQIRYLGKTPEELDPRLLERGEAAFALMERRLGESAFMACAAPTLADVSLLAYTRLAHEGGFDLAPFPRLRDWIARAEAALGVSA
ncbi:glutathione S-transferase family protein [Chenggangzhangella methanolivorans]|uniref:glutathione S-transferase family protein n=1 Tax=Chenggangzhangella methanolivorans TaxID=1437009 RepID=UPI003620F4CE